MNDSALFRQNRKEICSETRDPSAILEALSPTALADCSEIHESVTRVANVTAADSSSAFS